MQIPQLLPFTTFSQWGGGKIEHQFINWLHFTKIGCKGTKKSAYMQENRRKSAKFLHFVRKIGGNGRNGEKKITRQLDRGIQRRDAKRESNRQTISEDGRNTRTEDVGN